MNYTLLETPSFQGLNSAGKQIWQVHATMPTGEETFVFVILQKTELAIHRGICDRINGTSADVGQDPLDGGAVPPPPTLSLLALVYCDPNGDCEQQYITVDASNYDAIVVL